MIEIKDERVEIDALKTALLFIYNAYRKVELTGESALAVLYIGIIKNIVLYYSSKNGRSIPAEAGIDKLLV